MGDWLERSPLLSIAFVALAGVYLVRSVARAPSVLTAIDLDTVHLTFLTLGVALHGPPARLMRALREATPAGWGIPLQFPISAGIAAVIAKTHLNALIAGWFVGVSSAASFPALIAAYSMLLGVFVPSGGSKWVFEAPYVMQAAHELRVHLGWMVACDDLGEALANLVQPFWMLPVVGLFRLRARDVMGFTLLVFLVLTPLVLVLVTVLGMTLSYPRSAPRARYASPSVKVSVPASGSTTTRAPSGSSRLSATCPAGTPASTGTSSPARQPAIASSTVTPSRPGAASVNVPRTTAATRSSTPARRRCVSIRSTR